mmetsp:Transcript_24893/g.52331  ORF Transcript_24893/g.52331 Transcript_24893/m.52331 type:complete len:93 (-) Transcript_24893:2854-3132(-)
MGSTRLSNSTIKAAKVLNDPANPAIILVSTIRSSGPGFPAMIDPKLPLRAQLSKLQANVPKGNPGSFELYFFVKIHLAKQPNGVKRREIENC